MQTTLDVEELTPAQILGKAGGLKRAARLTAKQRLASSRKAIKARWKGHVKKPRKK